MTRRRRVKLLAPKQRAASIRIGLMLREPASVLMESRYQLRATDLMMAMILLSVVGYATERLIVGTLENKTTEKWEVKVL